jgi:hypothetical protein
MLQYVGFRMTTSSGTARRRFAPATWCLLAASGLRFYAGPFLGSLLQARPRSPKNLPAEAVGRQLFCFKHLRRLFPLSSSTHYTTSFTTLFPFTTTTFSFPSLYHNGFRRSASRVWPRAYAITNADAACPVNFRLTMCWQCSITGSAPAVTSSGKNTLYTIHLSFPRFSSAL